MENSKETLNLQSLFEFKEQLGADEQSLAVGSLVVGIRCQPLCDVGACGVVYAVDSATDTGLPRYWILFENGRSHHFHHETAYRRLHDLNCIDPSMSDFDFKDDAQVVSLFHRGQFHQAFSAARSLSKGFAWSAGLSLMH